VGEPKVIGTLDMKKISRLILVFTFLIHVSDFAAAELGPDYYYHKWRMPPVQTAVVNKGNLPVKTLIRAKVENTKISSLLKEAEKIIAKKPVLALLMIDEKNQIIFENYANGATEDSLIIGHSMTKSISSIIIGQYLCEGLIASLNEPAEKYSLSLKDTAYGNASIKDLLLMSSTGTKAVSQGQPEKGFNRDLILTKRRNIRDSFVEFGRNQKNPAQKNTFSYKGLDTAAISIVLADIKKTKYQNVISQNLWSVIGAEKNAEIIIDKNNDALAQSGFGATARDWARLGIFLRDNAKINSCYGSYLREATTGQISNKSDHGPSFLKYGYQIWTNNKFINTKSAWFNGFGGELIGVDLEGGKIIVLLSYDVGGVLDTYKLFDRWTQM
jgi:CubicO group peptidase (beta-lactamase class C family)